LRLESNPDEVQQAPIDIPGIPGAEEPPPDHRWVDWLELVVALAISGFFALALLGFILDLTSKQHVKSGLSRPGQFVVAAICAGILYLAARWARHAEHRLRHKRAEPAALALESGTAVKPVGAASPSPTTVKAPPHFSSPLRRRRHYSPASSLIAVVIFGTFTVGLVIGAFVVKADGARSAFTQHHGIPATGIVTHVNDIEDCGRSSCSWHSKITVHLRTPVRGATTTVVNYPDRSEVSAGDEVQILVDPRELGYAEFPGSPSVQSWQWILMLGIAAVFGALAAWAIREWLRQLRRRREQQQAAPAITPA
jgi:hypothetical protein